LRKRIRGKILKVTNKKSVVIQSLEKHVEIPKEKSVTIILEEAIAISVFLYMA
jgi:hypothetical protein